MAIERSNRRRPRVEIIPMIDVMFFMLVFFMLFTSFKTSPAGLNISLPKAATADQHVPGQLEISITSDGTFYVGNRRVEASALPALVAAEATKRPDMWVIVKGDRATRYEHIVSAMDAARSAGVYKIALGAELALDRQ